MKHCILVKWSEDIKDKDEIVNEVKTVFDKLLDIDGIRSVDYIMNCIDRSNRYDLLIRIDMDKEVLPIYDMSTPHLEWKKKYGKFAEKKAIFDFEE